MKDIKIAIETQCIDCNIDCLGSYDNNYYMLKDHLWKKFGPENGKGFICKECMEKRMNRKITIDDLNNSIASKVFAKSRGIK